MGLLIDSTAFISAERQRQTPEQLIAEVMDRWGDVELATSVISAGEFFHGRWRADTPSRRARREEFVEAIMAAVPVVPITRPPQMCCGRPTLSPQPKANYSPKRSWLPQRQQAST